MYKRQILKSSCFLIAAVHIVVDKGGVIAVNGVGRVEKYRFQILLDVTDFRGAVSYTHLVRIELKASSCAGIVIAFSACSRCVP